MVFAIDTRLVLAILGSLVKVKLPGIRGTYSLNFLFLLFGVVHFSLIQTLIALCAGAVAQTTLNTKRRPTTLQVLFNMANLTLSASICFLLARWLLSSSFGDSRPAVLALITGVYFATNTALVSGVITLLEGKRFGEVCEQWYFWSFPYYLVGATMVGLIPSPGETLHGEAWLILLPLLYLVHFFLGLQELHGSADPGQVEQSGKLPRRAKVYLVSVLVAGMAPLVFAALNWESHDPSRFAGYLLLTLAASTLKVRLPKVQETISVSFVLLLVAISEMSLPEAVVMSALAAAVQSLWKPKHRPTVVQVLFNLACLSLSTTLTYLACHWAMSTWLPGSVPCQVALSTLLLYSIDTVLVSVMIGLFQRKSLRPMWQHCFFWSCPYYLVGGATAGLMLVTIRVAGSLAPVLILPIMALVYVSYRVHVSRALAPVGHVVGVRGSDLALSR